MKSKDVIKRLEKQGWECRRIKGSHHHFRHPNSTRIITVPHPKSELPKGTVNKILKDAGLK